MDKDMKVYIKNNAKVTEDFIRTMESQEAAQEELDKVRKQTRKYRAASGLGVFLLIVILLYSIVTVITSTKDKTYYVDIERKMPNITTDDLEEFYMDVDYYCSMNGSTSGDSSYSVSIYTGGGSISDFKLNSTEMTDSFKLFQKWLTDRGVALDDKTSTQEYLYESAELLSQLCTTKMEYGVKNISKSEKRFKCSPAVHYNCSEGTKAGYEGLVNSYFNEDFVSMFSKVHKFDKVEQDNDYFYVSFYNEDIDIDEVCDIVAKFLSDNVYFFAQITYDNVSGDILVQQTNYISPEAPQFNVSSYDLNYVLNEAYGATTQYSITNRLTPSLSELDPDVKIGLSEEDDAPITVKFCISGEYYEYYAYLLHLYGLI